jgi:hypothetical protein
MDWVSEVEKLRAQRVVEVVWLCVSMARWTWTFVTQENVSTKHDTVAKKSSGGRKRRREKKSRECSEMCIQWKSLKDPKEDLCAPEIADVATTMHPAEAM